MQLLAFIKSSCKEVFLKRQRLDGKKAGTRPSNEAFDKAFEQLLHAPLVQNDSTPAQSGSG